MNNLNKDIAEVIGEISKVASLINIQGKHQIFVEDHGHVQQLTVKIHKGGWKEYADATLSQEIRYCPWENDTEEEKAESQKDALKKLKIVRDTLNKFLINGRVSMENREYNAEEVRHYRFY